MNTPTSFTIAPTQVFDLGGGGIRNTGTWTVHLDGRKREFRTLNMAKSAVRATLPDGTTLSWQRNEHGEWKGTVQ